MIKHKYWLLISVIAIILFLFPSGIVQGQSATAKIGVFEEITVSPDTLFEVPIMVEEVSELYAIDLEMNFDPAILEAQDADPNMDGIQLGFGSFLEPGLTLHNKVDNQQGVIRVTMTQANPSEPKSGSGILFVIYFKSLQTGESDLTFTLLQTASRKGELIESEAQNSQIKVDPSAPDVEATSIPVVNPTAQIIIPTSEPTQGEGDPLSTEQTAVDSNPTATQITASPTPTQIAPNPTSTQVPASPTATQVAPSDTPIAKVIDSSPTVASIEIEATQIAMNQSNPTSIVADEIVAEEPVDIESEAEQKDRFQLSQYWWVVLLFALLFIGIMIYALITFFVKKTS